MAKRRKVSNLLALAVLGNLAERPMHPYEMATVLKERGQDYSIKINWGSLYTVVANLERHGLVEATGTAREGHRPERTVYAITEAGRAELADWLRELLATPEKEYRRLAAGLCLLAALPPDEAVELLTRRERALLAEIATQRRICAETATKIPRLFLVEVEYELAILQAEVGWVRSLLTEIEEGTLPGLAEWRTLHERGIAPAEFARLLKEGGWDAG